MLIVLDNAAGEHQVRPLLPGTSGCAVLITSRARLAGVEGACLVDLNVLDRQQAVDLLARVAGAARVAAEPAAAERIVRSCGGLPLAVRVAGARLAARPHWRLSRLADELDDEHRRLDELRLGDLDVRASFALSYDSLDEPARCAFRRLGLLDLTDFPSWTAAALLDTTQDQAELLVETLVDAQLLDVTGHDALGQLRYCFHDLFRAYAREVAAEEPASDRLAALQRTFGGWMTLAEHGGRRTVSMAFEATVDVVSCWQPDNAIIDTVLAHPIRWFQVERVTLVGAVEQAHSLGADHLVEALGMRLAPGFLVRGCYFDGWSRVCEIMLASARRTHNRRGEGGALRGLGELALLQYRPNDALLYFEQAFAVFQTAGDRQSQALVTLGIGGAHVEAGRFNEGLVCLQQARTFFNEVGDYRSEVSALRRLSRLHQLQDRYEPAVKCLQQALATTGRLEDPFLEARVLQQLGDLHTLHGRGEDAYPLLDRALSLHRESQDLCGQAFTLGSLGELHHSEARPDQALNCLGDSLRLWRQLGRLQEQFHTLRRLAAVHDGNGNPQAAATARREARRLADELGIAETEEFIALPTYTPTLSRRCPARQ